jgi:hypothetical protein
MAVGRRFARVAPALALAAMAFVSNAAGAGTEALRGAIEERYAALAAVMDAGDFDGLRSFLAPDFVSIDESGKAEDADQMIATLRANPPDPSLVSTMTVGEITSSGETATVDQRYEGTVRRAGAGGTASEIRIVADSTDTWVRVDGVWRCRMTLTIWKDVYRDGALVSHVSGTRGL